MFGSIALDELLLAEKSARRLGFKVKAPTAAARLVAAGTAGTRYFVLARDQVALRAGVPGPAKLRLSKTTRRRLGRGGRLRVVLRITARDALANVQVVIRAITVRRPPRGGR